MLELERRYRSGGKGECPFPTPHPKKKVCQGEAGPNIEMLTIGFNCNFDMSKMLITRPKIQRIAFGGRASLESILRALTARSPRPNSWERVGERKGN